jgi:hypothetical protein
LCQGDVVWNVGVGWFWGLTGWFWAVFEGDFLGFWEVGQFGIGLNYSARKDCIGSTEAARRAGRAEAATASPRTAIAVSPITSGSKGLT